MPLPHSALIYVFLSKTFRDAPGLARPVRRLDVITMRASADTAMVPGRVSRRKRPLGTPARGAHITLPHSPLIYVFLSKTFSDAPGLSRPVRRHDVIAMRA